VIRGGDRELGGLIKGGLYGPGIMGVLEAWGERGGI